MTGHVGPRVGVVVNPTAGRGRGGLHGAATLRLLRHRGHRVTDLSDADPSVAARRAREAARGLDALVVVGGDGMAHLGVNAVAGTGVPLGIVPAGSGNDVATTLGMPRGDVVAAVRRIDEAMVAGGRPLDAVAVGPPGGGPTSWYLGVLSCGLDAAVSARAATLTRPAGSGRYVRALVTELRGFRPYGYRLTCDAGTWEGPASLVAVANAPRFGGGMRIAPAARMDDGMLDVVLAGPLSRQGILRVFPRVYSGTHTEHPACTVLRTRSVVVEHVGEGAVPPAAYADGEPVGALPLRAEVRSGAVRLLA